MRQLYLFLKIKCMESNMFKDITTHEMRTYVY